METKTAAFEALYYGSVLYEDRMMDSATIAALGELLEHVYMDEQKHFESCDGFDQMCHIFNNVVKLSRWTRDSKVDGG